jgi:hypothetical protein
MTATIAKTVIPEEIESSIVTRIAEEGYGPGAWHGNDFKAALADVSPKLAFQRPAAGAHNIAEIALHHAWVIRSVRGQIGGKPGKFVLEGEDWFPANDEKTLKWSRIVTVVEEEQAQLTKLLDSKRVASDRFELILGLTCHAVYHAGQVQLIKRLLQ